MKRRDFFRKSAGAGIALASLPGVFRGLTIDALAESPMQNAMKLLSQASDRVMVLIQLSGGNDGLNTVIPIENPVYYNSRPVLGIKKEEALKFTNNPTLGWHPAMPEFKELYDRNMMAVVEGVSYPNPDRSHFRGMDIWLTATDTNVFQSTGWIGRYLESLLPADPDELSPDPLAIQIGTNASLGFQSNHGSLGVTFQDPDAFYSLVGQNGTGNGEEPLPDTPSGDEIAFMRSIEESAQVYSKKIKEASDRVSGNKVAYPDTDLAGKLRIVSRLIAGGLNTKFYLVAVQGNSFDTHAMQGGTTGSHANLLAQLSGAVKAFLDDCEQLGTADRVAGMTFSEFGRRLQENAAGGTDHGTAAPLFVFGKNVLGGKITGSAPDLSKLDSRGDILMQYDYRQVYASALAQWFAAPQTEIQKVLFRDFMTIPLFREADTPSSVEEYGAELPKLTNYPNPFSESTRISFTLGSPAYVQLAVYDTGGRLVSRLYAGETQAGPFSQEFRTGSLPAGVYFCRLNAGSYSTMIPMQILR